MSDDPIGLSGGTNIYAYAYDDPTDFIDSSGFKPNDPGLPCGELGEGCSPPPPQNCSADPVPNNTKAEFEGF